MANLKKPKSNQAMDNDQNIVTTNSYLEVEKDHKDWYEINAMGKQRGKPKMVAKEVKKSPGVKKHSLRKEK